MITAMDDYPFDLMTERFSYRAEIGSNWKIYHRRVPGVLPRTDSALAAAGRRSPRDRGAGRGLRGSALRDRRSAPHGDAPTGGQGWRAPADRAASRWRHVTGSGLFGPWDAARTRLRPRLPAGRQSRRTRAVGTRPFQIWPNFVILDLGTRLVPHVPLLADVPQHPHLRGHLLLRAVDERARARARRRSRRSRSRTTRCRSGNTLEATQLDAGVAA